MPLGDLPCWTHRSRGACVFLLGELVLAPKLAEREALSDKGMFYYLLTLRRPARASLPAG